MSGSVTILKVTVPDDPETVLEVPPTIETVLEVNVVAEIPGAGDGAGGVSSHHDLDDLTDGDDHPQYLTTGRGDARYDAAGAAAAEATARATAVTGEATARNSAISTAVTAHAGASDPHGDRAYTDNVAAGKADLVGGLVPTAQIPALAITDTFTVASQAAMLALSAQKGDVAVRSDTNRTYILSGTDPTQLANWTLMPVPTDLVLSVNGQSGVVVLGYADVGAAATNDSRLTDTRTPTDATVTPAKFAASAIDPSAATAGARTLGTGGQQAAAGNDSRLSNARTPTAHAASHASAGSDAITIVESQVTNLPADLAAKVTNVSGVTGLWTGTQAAYNALTPSSTVLYFING